MPHNRDDQHEPANLPTTLFPGLAMAIGIASLQSLPGYLDSDYYFAGGLQLVEGKGFTEPYLWNYLDDPDSSRDRVL